MKINIRSSVRKAQSGDAGAFGDLYEIYALDMYKFALYFMGNTHDAEDAVQTACIKAYSSIISLRDPGSFKTWLFKILANVCKSELSSARAVRECGSPDGDITPEPADSSDFRLSAEIYDALGALSEDERQIVILSVVQKYKSSEIAEIINCPASTVRSKLSRSLSKLRTILT